ncbi:ATPase [Altericroceibacterium spongiae]|uniref:ATPase n=1 Tax=Altericroceibacterium spongiae TaxID=2320269 RepID=A0A420ER54_9SPHN|nr:cellulose synthase operon protein YhjQ/BcsQ [Altericroceibacterium spongiae]RKF23103.1 ATPase [Altericroceibacterium spongiae]
MTLILCHSAKGGVGTTFLAAQLAIRFAQAGRQVTAIDGSGQDSLKLHFGILPTQFAPNWSKSHTMPLVMSNVSLIDAHLDIREEYFLNSLRRGDLAREKGAIIIVDINSADRNLFRDLYDLADLHICPISPDPAALVSLSQLGGDQRTTELEKTVYVFNMQDDRHKLSRHSYRFVKELFDTRLVGTVRRDQAVFEALAMFEPLTKIAPNSVALSDLDELAQSILNMSELSDMPNFPDSDTSPSDPQAVNPSGSRVAS